MPAPATACRQQGTWRPSCDPDRCAERSPRPTSPGEQARESPHHPPGSTSPTGLLVVDGVNTATIEGAPDRTAVRARDLLKARPTGVRLSSTPGAYPYALPPWGILVIRCGEKTVIADTSHRRCVRYLADPGPLSCDRRSTHAPGPHAAPFRRAPFRRLPSGASLGASDIVSQRSASARRGYPRRLASYGGRVVKG